MIKNMMPRTTLKLPDFDSVTTKEDVAETMKKSLGDHGGIRVTVTKLNR